jgi:hypothetical protein
MGKFRMSVAPLLNIVPVANSTLRTGAEKPTGLTAKLRGVDPATTAREYSTDEREFLKAVDSYRTKNGRSFVTPTECLRIARELGYQKWGVSA